MVTRVRPEPSFNTLFEWAMLLRPADHPVWDYNSKTAGRELAERLGVRVPEILTGPAAIDRLVRPEGAFVLKPENGCSSRGVYPLTPAGRGTRLMDLFRNRTWEWDELVNDALEAEGASAGHQDEVRGPWFTEEMITNSSGLTYDWKLWVIGGKVELIWQSDRNGGGGRSRAVKWWTPDWRDAGDVAPHKALHIDPTLPPPVNGPAMIEAAERIGAEVAGPFVRVDMFDHEDGPIFGEITPQPFGGTIPFGPKWDAILGEAWLRTGMSM